MKFTSVEDTPEMVQAKISSKLVLDVCLNLIHSLIILSMNLCIEFGDNW